jgi:hypothetical protein
MPVSGNSEQWGVMARRKRFSKRAQEIEMFFQGSDRVHQTVRRVSERLEQAKILYVTRR